MKRTLFDHRINPLTLCIPFLEDLQAWAEAHTTLATERNEYTMLRGVNDNPAAFPQDFKVLDTKASGTPVLANHLSGADLFRQGSLPPPPPHSTFHATISDSFAARNMLHQLGILSLPIDYVSPG